MMEVLIMIGQLILGLSILVGVHEAGHMLSAKYFGMRVEKFFIGFPPKLFGFKKGETEYGLGAIPLGGFVKITGMIDESLDTSSLSAEPQPYEFRAKPAWQRLIVMMGGIIVNVIVGIIIFTLVAYYYGEEFISMNEINKRGIVAYPLAEKMGLRTGDKIVKVNDIKPEKFSDLYNPEVLLGKKGSYTVDREGQLVPLNIPSTLIGELANEKERFIEPIYPYKVAAVVKGSNAEKAGLQVDDKITSINGTAVEYFHDLQATLKKNSDKKVDMNVVRANKNIILKAQVDNTGKIGFQPQLLLEHSKTNYSFGESISNGLKSSFSFISLNIKGFSKIFSGELKAGDAVSGPIGIARMFGGVWEWEKFWRLVGGLSMILAFMNFLPIPALDGGHVMFLTYEIISGRKPSDKFLENAQKVGMVLLLSLMVFAVYNDVLKIFR